MSVENNAIASINTNSQGHTISVGVVGSEEPASQISGLFINITKGSDADSITLDQLVAILKSPERTLVITPFTKKEGVLSNLVVDAPSAEEASDAVLATDTSDDVVAEDEVLSDEDAQALAELEAESEEEPAQASA